MLREEGAQEVGWREVVFRLGKFWLMAVFRLTHCVNCMDGARSCRGGMVWTRTQTGDICVLGFSYGRNDGLEIVVC